MHDTPVLIPRRRAGVAVKGFSCGGSPEITALSIMYAELIISYSCEKPIEKLLSGFSVRRVNWQIQEDAEKTRKS